MGHFRVNLEEMHEKKNQMQEMQDYLNLMEKEP